MRPSESTNACTDRGLIRMLRGTRVAGSLILALGAAGCSGSSAAAPASRAPLPRSAAPPPAPRLRSDLFHAARVALVPTGTFGPYVGSRPGATIAAWAADVSGKRRWITRALGESGAPLAEPKTVADAATEVDLVAIRPLAGDKARAFLLLASSHEFSGERVDAVALGPAGELRGGPTPLAESLGDVVWVDAFPTESGALALWAVRHEERASIYGVAVGASGEPTDEPAVLVSDVRSWQIAPATGGVVIAAVTAGKARGERGPIRATFVDTRGRVEKKAVVVSPSTTSLLDLDIARMGDRLVLAWSDDRDLEPRLYGAVMDNEGNVVKPPAALGRPFGPQAVLRVVPPASGAGPAFLAWENALERTPAGRAIRLGKLSADGVLSEDVGVLDFAPSDGSVPEFAATPRGVGALTLAPACRRGAPCSDDRAVPTFVQFDGALDVVASEPLRLDELGGETADLGWGLTCPSLSCFALVAAPKSPAPVYAVELGALAGSFRPAGHRFATARAPRAARIEAIGRSDSVADLAATRVGASTLAAWVSYFDPTTPFVKPKTPAPDGKYEPVRAMLGVRSLPDEGPRPEPVVVSYRAHSFGGVAVAPGDPARGDALLAWSAVDNKEPQVFVTLLGQDGKKKAQKMLTHTKSGVSDVATAFAGDGWFVAWVDERTGVSQVYLTKVDNRLRPMMPDRRIGTNASTATGVQLIVRGDHLVVVWSDARGPTPGVSDIFVARLSTKDLSAIGPEHPIAITPAHSRSPAIAAFGEDEVVAWIEDVPASGSGGAASLMLAELDAGAETVAGSVTTATLPGSPQGVGLSCGPNTCHVVTPVVSSEGAEIDGFAWSGRGGARGLRLVGLSAVPKGAVAPAVIDSDVLYADEYGRDARIRRMAVDWE